MTLTTIQVTVLCAVGILLLAGPAHAFGAGNIASVSKIEGQNWRHGDIEDVLLGIVASRALGKKFSKLDVKRVYFGNWLRDYSQAVDVGTLKSVSAKAITLLLWILGFMSFGYGTGEFEVTMERLGCYRPEEHIDNPKDYADNNDARQYDRRLRGPVDERRELSIDPELGMKNYIASENMGITTSAGLVRDLFSRCIQLGRQYNRNRNKKDLYEALRLLGTACHCLEDFSAHSNYTELALIELGERDVFPHVGRNTQIQLRGSRRPVWPLITGTFGGVDLLHSVTGEFDDKVTQSEVQELENTMSQAQQQGENKSALQDLLSKIPSGIFGDKDESSQADQLKQDAVAHQMANTHISPREPEEWTQYLDNARQQIYPIIQYHDEIMQGITETIEKIPVLPDLLENLQEQLNVFVFSLIAPYMLPIIRQIKSELNTGSNAIIESSENQQHIVFQDDDSTNPTHSMLSKDHFSNILNEPAGKVAGQVLRWVVPQIMAAWDDENIDVSRTMNRIVRGVLHHPALRDYGDDGASDGRRLMFGVVEQWWGEKSEREKDSFRDQLSREGVRAGRNHKEGVHDHGHGSGKPLSMPGVHTSKSSGAPGGFGGQTQIANQASKMASEAVGGGLLGGLVGGLVSGVGGDILGGGLNQEKRSYRQDDGHTETVTQYGRSGNTYGQAQYSRTDDESGRTEQYSRYEQTSTGGGYQTEYRHEERSNQGYHQETRRYESSQDQYQRHDDYSSRDSYSDRRDEYGARDEYSAGRSDEYGRSNDGFGRQNEDSYGRRGQESDRYGGQQSYGRESQGYGAQQTYGREDRHGGREDERSYGGREEERSYGRQDESREYSGGYGRQEETHGQQRYGRDDEEPSRGYGGGGYGRRDDDDDGEYRRREDDEEAY